MSSSSNPLIPALFLSIIVLGAAEQTIAAQQQPASGHSPSVPGQAFHDWRSALIANRFSSSSPSSTSSSSSSSSGVLSDIFSSLPRQKQQHPTPWVNIVAARERIGIIQGPPGRTATHPAADRRLWIAQALIAKAGSDADAAAKAAAALAAGSIATGTLVQPPGGGDAAAAASTAATTITQPQHHHKARALQQQQQQQQKMQPQWQAAAAAAAAADPLHDPASTTTSMKRPEDGAGISGDAVEVEESRLLSQLTVLLRRQPYKPLKTDLKDLQDTLMHFVHRGSKGRLYVQGKPWLLKGMDVPEALQMAAGGPVPRTQLLYLLDRAQTLGLNTLRFWAFADGAPGVGSAVERDWQSDAAMAGAGAGSSSLEDRARAYIALQPAPGVLNGTMLSEGLDWLVHECGLRGIRLLPVLTNGGSAELGGMKQYVDWVDPMLTVADFYTNDTIKSVFLDYVGAVLSHTSSLSGIPLREDPVILGWQLAEDASHPGHPSSQVLLGWLKQFGVFMKQRAPHQLLLAGVLDLFGHNSPHHLQYNPYAQVFSPASHTPLNYEARCHGTDFWLHHQLPEVDVALTGVFPDMHLACNASCKLDWAQEWIRAHLRDALRMNKPLILGGVGALRPQWWRLQVLKLVRTEVEGALQRDNPIGGFILSGLSHPDMPDSSGWSIFYTSKGVHAARAPVANLNTQAVFDVTWRRFLNYDAFLMCSALQTRGVSNDKGEAGNTKAWVDGWEEVVAAVAAMGKVSPDVPAA